MSELKGRRLPDGNHPYEQVKPGDYWKPGYEHRQPDEWWFRDPGGALGRVVKHTVIEHEDGTITVNPSILRYPCPPEFPEGWHGWLKKGVWSW